MNFSSRRLQPTRRPSMLAVLSLLIALAFLLPALPPASAASGPHEWTPPAVIYGESIGRLTPATKIQEDAIGNRMAVWFDFAGLQGLFASVASAGGSWTPPLPIDSRTATNIVGFDFAMSSSGYAAVGWLSHYHLLNSYDRYSVDGAFYHPGAGWSYATTVSAVDQNDYGNPGRASVPVVDIDDDGEAVIVWTQTVDYLGTNETDVYAAHNAPPWVNWTAPDVLDALPGDPDLVDVAAAEGGTDVAVWRQVDGLNRSLYSSVYNHTTGWSAAELRESSPENIELLAVDAASPGAVVLTWTQGPSGATSVFASSLAGGAWGSVETLDTVAAPHGSLKVAANRGGAAVALWSMVTPPTYSLRGSTFDPATGWRPAEVVESMEWYPSATRPGIDADGDAMFLWTGLQDPYHATVRATRYVNGTGWLPGQDATPGGNAPDDLVVSPDGHASAALRHFDGTIYRPYEIQYLPSDTTAPPLDLQEPLPGATSASRFVTFRGSTEPGASVTVNGAPVFVSANGSFEALVQLPVGSSAVSVVARDRAQNAATVSLTVTVADDLASLVTRIDALEAALNATGSDLAAIEADVASLRASVDTNASGQAQLASRIDALDARVAAARADLNATAAAASQAGTAASRAEAGAGTSTLALAAGVVGAALGALAMVMARPRRPGGSSSAPPERTRPDANARDEGADARKLEDAPP